MTSVYKVLMGIIILLTNVHTSDATYDRLQDWLARGGSTEIKILQILEDLAETQDRFDYKIERLEARLRAASSRERRTELARRLQSEKDKLASAVDGFDKQILDLTDGHRTSEDGISTQQSILLEIALGADLDLTEKEFRRLLKRIHKEQARIFQDGDAQGIIASEILRWIEPAIERRRRSQSDKLRHASGQCVPSKYLKLKCRAAMTLALNDYRQQKNLVPRWDRNSEQKPPGPKAKRAYNEFGYMFPEGGNRRIASDQYEPLEEAAEVFVTRMMVEQICLEPPRPFILHDVEDNSARCEKMVQWIDWFGRTERCLSESYERQARDYEVKASSYLRTACR